MSMESFYGGRQGASFVIVKQFDGIDIPQSIASPVYKIKYYATTADGNYYLYDNGFIERNSNNYSLYPWKTCPLNGLSVNIELPDGTHSTQVVSSVLAEGMRQCFEQGGATTDKVNYGEYVIIDTISKKNPDNGKVYRRGMNFDYNANTNPLAGAEYISQIVGPQGETPELDIDHYEAIVAQPGNKTGTYTETTEDLVPGIEWDTATVAWKYNDDIKYASVNIIDEYNNIIGCEIGFKLPTLVVDYEAESVNAYDTRYRHQDPETGKYYYTDLIEQNEEQYVDNKWQHPFYEKWDIKIPEGIHGIDSINLERIPTKTIPKGFLSEDFLGAELFYDEACTDHLGYLEESVDILMNQNPQGDADYYVIYDSQGNLQSAAVPYNGGRCYVKISECYKDILRYQEKNYTNIEEGEITYNFAGYINDIDGIELTEEGKLYIYYSNGTKKYIPQDITWIKEVSLNQRGLFKVKYNNDKATNITNPEDNSYQNTLEWIDWVTVTNDGTINFWKNTDETGPSYTPIQRLKYIKEMKVNNLGVPGDPTSEGQGNQKLHVKYNTTHAEPIDPTHWDPDDPSTYEMVQDEEDISYPLNYIMESTIFVPSVQFPETDNVKYGHLLIYFSDPDLRHTLTTKYPTKVVRYPSVKYEGKIWDDWYDIGNLKQEAVGIRIIKDINNLDDLYKDGSARTDPYRPEELMDATGAFVVGTEGRGWSVTYTHSETDPGTGDVHIITDIYCFDYENGDWYKVKDFDSILINPKAIIDKSEPNSQQKPDSDDLNAYGFWLASETAIYAQ